MRKYINHILLIFVLALILSDCGPSQSEYDKLKLENEKLKVELDELKFGAERLYNTAETAFNNKNYDNTISLLNTLFEKHPESQEAKNGKKLLFKAKKALKNQKAAEKKAERLKIQKEKQRLANATKRMYKDHDDIKGLTWYRDRTSPKYTNINGIYLYFSKDDNSKTASNLRFKIQYVDDDWLFIKSYLFNIDGEKISYTPYDTERDNGSGDIWEWSDESVNKHIYSIVKAITNSKNAKIRFNGSQYYKDKTITYKQKIALKNVLNAYEALGGSLNFY